MKRKGTIYYARPVARWKKAATKISDAFWTIFAPMMSLPGVLIICAVISVGLVFGAHLLSR